jgi:hypothetical protein
MNKLKRLLAQFLPQTNEILDKQNLINGNNYYMNNIIQNQIYKATPYSKNI